MDKARFNELKGKLKNKPFYTKKDVDSLLVIALFSRGDFPSDKDSVNIVSEKADEIGAKCSKWIMDRR